MGFLELDDLKVCKSLYSKTRGLMFSRKRNLVFVFLDDQKVSLHNMFVFFCIDVFFLDKDKRIVEIKRNLKPFWFYNPSTKARYVIEIAKEKEKRYLKKAKIGDKIFLKVNRVNQ